MIKTSGFINKSGFYGENYGTVSGTVKDFGEPEARLLARLRISDTVSGMVKDFWHG